MSIATVLHMTYDASDDAHVSSKGYDVRHPYELKHQITGLLVNACIVNKTTVETCVTRKKSFVNL